MTIKCTHCKRLLSEENFNWKVKNIRRSHHCRECSRDYVKKHYREHIDYYLTKAKRRNIQVKDKLEEYISKYLLSHPCVDCAIDNILVLEFDHIDHDLKINDVSTMIRKGFSFEKIVQEIEKCQVRCANCHRIKTAKEINSWKLKYAPVAQLDRAPVFGTGFAGVQIPPGAQ